MVLLSAELAPVTAMASAAFMFMFICPFLLLLGRTAEEELMTPPPPLRILAWRDGGNWLKRGPMGAGVGRGGIGIPLMSMCRWPLC